MPTLSADKTLVVKHADAHDVPPKTRADDLSRPRGSEEHTGLMRRTHEPPTDGLCVCVCVQQEAAFWNTCRHSALPLLSHHSCSDRNRNSLCFSAQSGSSR